VVRVLSMDAGLGGLLSRELCFRTDVAESTGADTLEEHRLIALFGGMRRLLERLAGAQEDGRGACVVLSDGKPVDFSPFPLDIHGAGNSGLERREFDTFGAAVEFYFSGAVEGSGLGRFSHEPGERALKKSAAERRTALEKAEFRLRQQQEAAANFREEMEENTENGELLYLHYNYFGKLLAGLEKAREELGWEGIGRRLAAVPAVKEILPDEGLARVTVPGSERTLLLDPRKSVNVNANDCYEAAKRARQKLRGVQAAMKDTEKKIEELRERQEGLIAEREQRKARRSTGRKLWFEHYRWFFSSTGHLVLGGKNVRSNDRLVKKHLKGSDRYAHADTSGAPSVVIKSERYVLMPKLEEITAETGTAAGAEEPVFDGKTMEEACLFAACFSRAWAQNLGAISAYWVLPSQVSKTPRSGEFLAKGAFVIRGKRNHVRTSMRLAVGPLEIDGMRKAMCGPESAVRAHCDKLAVMIPGETKKTGAAAQLARAFGLDTDELVSVLPGDVRIVETKGFKL